MPKKKEFLLFLLIFFIFLVAYTPFILHGGFGPGDDLSHISQSLNNFNIGTYVKENLTGASSSRPVAIIVLACALQLYGNNPFLYIITQLLLWLLTIFFLAPVIYRIFDKYTAWIFIFLMLFPIFCATNIFSPFLFAGYGLPIFFWATSLFFLDRHIVKRRSCCYFLSYLFLILGLFSLPLILPLLIITAIFPVIYEYKIDGEKRIDELLRLAVKYISPVIIVGIVFFIFVYIAQYYQATYEGVYALAPVTLKSFLQGGFYFLALLYEVPLLLLEVIPLMLRLQVLFAGILVTTFFIILGKEIKKRGQDAVKTDKASKESLYTWLIIVSLIAYSSLFFVTNYPAVTYGYYNKMMLPSFILVSILLSRIIKGMLRSRWGSLAIIISVLWASSMMVQLDNFIESWQIRKKVFKDCVAKLNKRDLGKDPTLIANTPNFTKNNYNNEEVFWLRGPFRDGLKIFGAEQDVRVFPVCWRTVINKDYYPKHNIRNYIDEFSRYANFWYYEFNSKTGLSKLERINGRRDLEAKFQYIKENKINFHFIRPREAIRLKFKRFVQKI